MSGKAARRIRKGKKLSKKSLAICAGICLSSAPISAGGEFLVSLYPHLSKPFGQSNGMEYGLGAGLKLTFRPTSFLNIFAQGDYLSMQVPNVDPVTVFNGGLGAGYHLFLSDRLALDFNVDVGAYNAKSSSKVTGISGGAAITFTYKLNPIIYTDVTASASHYAAPSKPLMMLNTTLSPGVTFNISEMFKSAAKINVEENYLDPVFPVLYSWYEENSFGQVEITNNEDSSVTDVTISFYQPQYMSNPKECAKFARLEKQESVNVDLVAFFNEQMLELTEKTDTQSYVIVNYSCLGQRRSKTYTMNVPVYGRNNMSWDDDRRAAVFVSSKDPAAMLFAKYVTSIVRDNVRGGVPKNIQYAMGIFEVLDQFGLNYVVDPSSAFEDNVGTSSIDFLQFPYQTLMYRGGDCDDLSILVCSLFEAVGIKTAFITIPGHIFMAFDSGLTVAQAQEQFASLKEFIVMGNEVWVPLEITLTDEGFNKAWRVGAREWNTADKAGVAEMYKMHDSWKLYQPISVPGATAYFTMPDTEIITKLFDHSIDQWIAREIDPQIKMYEAKLAVKDDDKTRNSLGVLYGKYGLFVQADEQFKKARRKGYTPSILNTGNIYYSKQEYDLARKWYRSVLDKDPENELAMIGIARCAYELADYDECDIFYARVMRSNPELAADYAYLGSFVNSKGRAFSLADRLTYTVWSEEKDPVPENIIVEETNTADAILKDSPLSDSALQDILNLAKDSVAVIPPQEQKEEESEQEQPQSTEGGDGDNNTEATDDSVEESVEEPAPQKVVAESSVTETVESLPEETPVQKPVQEVDLSSFTENFNGLASEVDFSADSFMEELTKAAEAVVKENEIAKKTEEVAVTAPAAKESTPAAKESTPAVKESTPAEKQTPAPEVNLVQVQENLTTQADELAETTENLTTAAQELAVAAEELTAVQESLAETTEKLAAAQERLAEVTEQNIEEEYQPDPEEFDLDEFLYEESLAMEEVAPATQEAAVATTEAEPATQETALATAEEAAPATTEEAAVATEKAAVATEEAAPLESEPEVKIADIAVPRFTDQPSAEWAPEAAYTANYIPGMKSYEEEMGEYQNEKAFLYEDKKVLSVDPDHDFDVEETKENTKVATSGLPDVDPFSSYLSKEDAKKVAAITNYSIEKVKQEAQAKVEAAVEKTEKVIQPKVETIKETKAEVKEIIQETIETKIEDAIQTSVENKAESVAGVKTAADIPSEQKKIPFGRVAAGAAAILAAGAAGIFISKKNKKREEEK